MAGALIIGVLAHLAKATFLGNLSIVVALIATLNRFVLTPASIRFQKGPLVRLESFYNRTISYALKVTDQFGSFWALCCCFSEVVPAWASFRRRSFISGRRPHLCERIHSGSIGN